MQVVCGYTCLLMKCVFRSYLSISPHIHTHTRLASACFDTQLKVWMEIQKRDKRVKVKLNWSWLYLVFISLWLLCKLKIPADNTQQHSNRKHVWYQCDSLKTWLLRSGTVRLTFSQRGMRWGLYSHYPDPHLNQSRIYMGTLTNISLNPRIILCKLWWTWSSPTGWRKRCWALATPARMAKTPHWR